VTGAAREIRIVETMAQLDTGALQPETPKSSAGRRAVAFPYELAPEVRWHLERFAEPGERGLVFVGPQGAILRRSNFRRIRVRACERAGISDLHFHDLRHTGGTLAAASGASLRELMARLGHSSTRAALIYQHASRDRDRAIADHSGCWRCDLTLWVGAGEGNRTLMTSLEGAPRMAVMDADLHVGVDSGSRGLPLVTPVNGTLMAR